MRAHSDRALAVPRQGPLNRSRQGTAATSDVVLTAPTEKMATRRRLSSVPKTPPKQDIVEYAREVIRAEAEALAQLPLRLNGAFARAVEMVLACPGRVVVTGMGKPGFIAQKISATFASTGTPSLYLHPAEALHGDLGRVAREDVVLALSNSGETEELLRLLPALKRIGARVVAMTRDHANPLARGADLVVPFGAIEEPCPMGLAP